MNSSTNRFVSFKIYLFISCLHTCMFPAYCFRQRTYMAEGDVNGLLNETWTPSCLEFEWFSFGYIYIYIYIYIITNSSARTQCDTMSITLAELSILKSEFPFSKVGCHTKVKMPNLSNYLPIGGERMLWFIHFSKVLALCEIQKKLVQDLNSNRYIYFLRRWPSHNECPWCA